MDTRLRTSTQLDASNSIILHEYVHFSFSENEIKTIVNLESSGMYYEWQEK